jgi:2-polyprenyl-6-methoxyphenol hydroxylase-like FAD-dependent oxidoreductase
MMLKQLTSNSPVAKDSAVVIGGSIAGMLAAHILAKHFKQVTIIERDRLPDTPIPRASVPQSFQAHGLLKKGALLLEEFFPGFLKELESNGSFTANFPEDFNFFFGGEWLPKFPSDITIYCQTRPFLELQIKQRLKANPNIAFLTEAIVTDLIASADQTRVLGVKIQSQTESEILADLVVDASGQAAITTKCLEKLGYSSPPITSIPINITYASRIYRHTQNLVGKRQPVGINPMPHICHRAGGFFPIENNNWIVLLAGYTGEQVPNNEEGFLEFARSLPQPQVYEWLKNAEPLTPIHVYKMPASVRRQYEKLAKFPLGLLPIGDSICKFNPIYGQGMTVCALEAEVLDRCLRECQNLVQLQRQYFRAVGKTIDTPWNLTVSEDVQYLASEPSKLPLDQLSQWYLKNLLAVCLINRDVCLEFFRVVHMVKQPTALFSPRVLLPVLAYGIGLNRQRSLNPIPAVNI